jgi:hypothetical protein
MKDMTYWMKTSSLMLAALALAAQVSMAQLTANRDTPARSGETVALLQGSNVIYRGSMVAVDAAGKAVAASDTASTKVVGRAQSMQVNTGTAYSATRTIDVRRGLFRWTNGGVFTIANIGDFAYVEDDATVTTAALASNDIIAGIIVDVDADGVWVDTYAIPAIGAGSFAAITAAGNAAVGGTLAVTGNTTLGGTAGITGNTTVGGTLGVTGNGTVGGTLGVTGVVTLTAAPKLTAVTSAGAQTVTMTNAPAAGVPVWANVAVGTNSYVVPLFPRQ